MHVDAQEGDRVFWFTTTGWMMWNFLASILLTPASIVLYDGSPGYPDMGALWDLAERSGNASARARGSRTSTPQPASANDGPELVGAGPGREAQAADRSGHGHQHPSRRCGRHPVAAQD
jgi:hypothetical protein